MPQTKTEPTGGVRLRLLDRFELTCGSEAVTVPLAPQRVVAFLALHGGLVDRGHLAGQLWFRRETSNVQACLRSALWRLHRESPTLPVVEATRTQVRLAPEVVVDAQEQIPLARRVFDRSAPIDDSVDYHALLAGELLPDWHDEWVSFERERLRQIRLHALDALAGRLTEAKRYGEAVDTALAVLSADPLRETAHRTLINIYLAEGNRVEAIRQYETYRELLKKRLDLEPAAAVEALVRHLPTARSVATS